MAEEKEFSNEQTGIPWKRRILEGLFIVFSILISFFLEDIRQENEEIEKFQSNSSEIELGIDHKEYSHSTKLSKENIASLSADFS